jgi:signal transduction histidine kinase
MLEQLLDSAPVAAPVALACASVAVAERVRGRRRRNRLNRALHELRRPLQALALAVPHRPRAASAQLDLALDALAALDREVNAADGRREMRPADARALVEQAVERWRVAAQCCGRGIDVAWHANGSRVVCVPGAIARALDNLIANSLEHGRGTLRVEATARAGRLRLMVADGETPAGAGAPQGEVRRRARRGGDPRRGHGLRVVADVAAEHGGRFAACRHAGGVTAVLELPLA